MKLFRRKSDDTSIPGLTERLETILEIVKGADTETNTIKRYQTRHNMLLATCIELSGLLPLNQRKIVREIIRWCRHN